MPVLAGALAVEGPAEDGGFAQVLAEPLDHEGRLAGAAGGDDLDHVGVGVGPGVVEEGELFVATDDIRVDGGELAGEGADLRRRGRGRAIKFLFNPLHDLVSVSSVRVDGLQRTAFKGATGILVVIAD